MTIPAADRPVPLRKVLLFISLDIHIILHRETTSRIIEKNKLNTNDIKSIKNLLTAPLSNQFIQCITNKFISQRVSVCIGNISQL